MSVQIEEKASASECQTLYLTLLQSKGIAARAATAYIRQFQETARCDRFNYFSQARERYAKQLGPETMPRIATYDETVKDERMATTAVLGSHVDHERLLTSALDFKTRLGYETFFKLERSVADLTGGSATYGGWKIVQRTFDHIHACQRSATPATSGQNE
jgi:hypothetical protein